MTGLEIALLAALAVVWFFGAVMARSYARDAGWNEPLWAVVIWPFCILAAYLSLACNYLAGRR